MTHTYKIIGMTCKGCRDKVENALNGIDGISAKVTLVDIPEPFDSLRRKLN